MVVEYRTVRHGDRYFLKKAPIVYSAFIKLRGEIIRQLRHVRDAKLSGNKAFTLINKSIIIHVLSLKGPSKMINQLFSHLTKLSLLSIFLMGCAVTETNRVVESRKVESYDEIYSGPKTSLVVSNFQNRSNYMQGLFSSDIDQLGNQAKTILKTHLQQTNRFKIVDRDSMKEIQTEADIRGQSQNLKGARYSVSGSVSEFGRKTTGDKQLFGILGSGKTQTAYAKVSLTVVDVLTSEIIYTTQGAGEYALSEREVIGFGSNASYDATLNGKVLNLAITEAVNEIVRAHKAGLLKVAND